VRKILILYAHPGGRHSIANQALVRVAQSVDAVTFVDLYAEYPRAKIDIDREQARLIEHDAIVMQFPLLWYSTPSLLKEWQDLVLEYGFAYGEGGDKLHGKLLLAAVTAGGPLDAYGPDGYNNFDLRTLLTPLEQTANLCGLRFLPPYVLFGSLRARSQGGIDEHARGYGALLAALGNETLDLDRALAEKTLTCDALPITQGAR